MKAIILAAGFGSRMASLAPDFPKCLLKINDETILDRQIRFLKNCGINDIVVATGFHAEKLMEACDKDIKFFHNPDFQTTTNLHTLWLGRDYMKDDFIVLFADVVFEQEVLEALLKDKNDFCLAIDKKACDEEEVKVVVDPMEKIITGIGKDVPISDAFGEVLYMIKVQGKGVDAFNKFLSVSTEKYRDNNSRWFNVFQELIKAGHELSYVLPKSPWLECDTPEDYSLAKKIFESK